MARVETKRLIELAGFVLACIALVYVGYLLVINWQGIAHWQVPPGFIANLFGLCLLFALCGFLLSSAWHLLLEACQAGPVRLKWSHWAYGATQVAKYLPGNVFHFAGRHLLGRAAGLSHRGLLYSALLETWLLALTALVLIVAGGDWDRVPHGAMLLFAVCALGLIAVLLVLNIERAGEFWHAIVMGLRAHARRIAAAAALYTGFFVITGLLFVQLISLVTGMGWPNDPLRFVSMFVLAWLAGFIVPGAPAGIGIRETLLVASLAPDFQAHQALIVVACLRLTTLLGDLGFFFITRPLACGGRRR